MGAMEGVAGGGRRRISLLWPQFLYWVGDDGGSGGSRGLCNKDPGSLPKLSLYAVCAGAAGQTRRSLVSASIITGQISPS